MAMGSLMYLTLFRAVEAFVALKINIVQDVDIGRTTHDVEFAKGA
jgi:hypothetical protein